MAIIWDDVARCSVRRGGRPANCSQQDPPNARTCRDADRQNTQSEFPFSQQPISHGAPMRLSGARMRRRNLRERSIQLPEIRPLQVTHLPGIRAMNTADANSSRKTHPNAATAMPGVCESICDPPYQAPKVRSSICSGNQIRASIGTETRVTIQNPEGIHIARRYAAATTRSDKIRERLSITNSIIQIWVRHSQTSPASGS